MILISNDFWHKIKMYNFDPYNVLLVIATNIAVLRMTASVLQGHKCPAKRLTEDLMNDSPNMTRFIFLE